MRNPAVAFRDLLPTDSRSHGTVVATHQDGTSTVESPTGTTYRVQGTTLPAGAAAWITGGRIDSEAPAMAVYEVEIE